MYTPLHGTGSKLVPQAFRAFGFTNIMIVTEQASLGSDFSTVESPNLEEPEAFPTAIQYGKKKGLNCCSQRILMSTER